MQIASRVFQSLLASFGRVLGQVEGEIECWGYLSSASDETAAYRLLKSPWEFRAYRFRSSEVSSRVWEVDSLNRDFLQVWNLRSAYLRNKVDLISKLNTSKRNPIASEQASKLLKWISGIERIIPAVGTYLVIKINSLCFERQIEVGLHTSKD